MKCDSQEAAARLFVAVEIGDESRTRLCGLQERLRDTGFRARWVAAAQFHITLCFLGSVRVSRVPEIQAVIAAALSGVGAFGCALRGAGWFGRRQAPRVLWAGVGEGADVLITAQAGIAEGLQNLGLELETRDYTPHVTLARIRSPRPCRTLANRLEEEQATNLGRFEVERIVLMRSELTPKGPTYGVVGVVPLVG
jgi:2'-5' RNA ligase